MPPTVFTDQSGPTPGTPLDASHINGLVAADLSEPATNDTLSGASTFWNNLNRVRYQLGIVIGGAGSAWNAAVQMIPLSQKGAASGVAGLTAQKLLDLSSAGTPTVTVGAAAGTGASASVAAGSTDARGVINVTTGTGTSVGTLFTVTFSAALAAAPHTVLVGLQGPNLAQVPTVSAVTAAQWVATDAALAASASFGFSYLVLP